MINIVIAGAAGRMGQALIRCARRFDKIRIIGAVERPGHSDLDKDAGSVAGIDSINVRLNDSLPDALKNADVLIDFTLHSTVQENANIAVGMRRAMVIGTTGLMPNETEVINLAASKIPIVWAPNMSLGVNLLFSVLKKAGSIFSDGYVIEIDETHHVHKKDSPSGTALRLGEKIAEGLGQELNRLMLHDAENPDMAAVPGKIVIRSHREGEAIGDHAVTFTNESERIEFTHKAFSRDAFAMGALRAAQWVVTQRPGLYDMQNVLSL
ncbi:MAG: 4-hydroxy-tetrahydrodipicolinate reductase [Lentisphaerae bacterium]|nr:4-hydroxy-tetrahydrodipicolinate reductase [Lentisphaerota bacterium]